VLGVLGLLGALTMAGCTTSDDGSVPTAGVSYGGGEISEAQYVSIVRAVHACMADKGYDVEDVQRRTDGVTYGFAFSGSAAERVDGRSPNGSRDLSDCEQVYGLPEAEVAYQDQQALSGAEREALYAQFVGCMDAAGLDGITVGDQAADVQDRLAAATDSGQDVGAAEGCWTQYSTRLFSGSQG
jgi:hypothetical protein